MGVDVVGFIVGFLRRVGIIRWADVSVLYDLVCVGGFLRYLLIVFKISRCVDLHELLDVDDVMSWSDDAVSVHSFACEVVNDLYPLVAERDAESLCGDAVNRDEGSWC